jgi:hypothetical protein
VKYLHARYVAFRSILKAIYTLLADL